MLSTRTNISNFCMLRKSYWHIVSRLSLRLTQITAFYVNRSFYDVRLINPNSILALQTPTQIFLIGYFMVDVNLWRAVADPGIWKRGGAVKGRGSGGRLEAPCGSRGRSPWKLLKSRYFERQNHVVWRANFYLFSRHFSH